MKKTRKIFGVLLTILGVAVSVIIALTFAVTLYDRSEYDTGIGELWIFPLLILAGLSIVLLGVRLIRSSSDKKEIKAKTPPEGAEATAYKTFKSSPKEQLKVFSFIVFFPALFPVLLVVLTNLNSLEMIAGILKPVLSILLPFSILLALPVACITYRIRVEIGSFGIRFYRGRHMYASYPLDCSFHVATIAGDVNRPYFVQAISIGHGNQKEKRQVFFGFSKRDFSAVWNELRSLVDVEQAVKKQYQSVQFFAIPKADIKAAMRQRVPQTFSMFLVLGGLVVTLFTGLVYIPNKDVLSGKIVYIGMLAFALIAVLAALIVSLQNKRLSGLIPEKTEFCDGWLKFADKLYYASQLTKIEYTPAMYCPQNVGKPFYRYLVVSTQSETGVYLLGHKATVQNQVYQDYSLLISALCDWCESQGVTHFTVSNPCVNVKKAAENFADKYTS